ncbi:LysE family translocator [Candidatus Pelagibacter sp. Uisw_090]|uniref:LysE family translocator n=1 Tax=Candidatus Pelagibacter sp. Uisw_090 TaxID=3230993 RepID=UPI0039EA52D5
MHPEILSLSLFMFVTRCSPGPNNIVASHSGFNHGIKKTIPLMLGVIFGFTTMIAIVNFGLINIFKLYPIIQKILILTGTIFLIYLAYKISFSKNNTQEKSLNAVSFFETFMYQFLNPKGVVVAIISVSTYVEPGGNFLNHSSWVIGVAFIFAIISIHFWVFIGKFMRKFATNDKFIKWFNYVMSLLLLSCIATFYL